MHVNKLPRMIMIVQQDRVDEHFNVMFTLVYSHSWKP